MIAHALVVFALVVTALLLALVFYETIASARDKRKFPPTGRILDVDGCRVHVHEQGRGSPTVVFESGLAASSLSWTYVQARVAAFAHTVSYDRAGFGWSDPCPSPLTLSAMAGHLEKFLVRAGIPPPYILVGHSFGALVVRAFTHANPQSVAGLVFVEPVSIQTWAECSPTNRARLAYGARLSRRGALLARLGVVRAALAAFAAGQRTLPQLIGRASSGRGNDTLNRLVGEVGKLPPEILPTVRSHWSSAKPFESMASHLECLPDAAQTAREMPFPPAIPLIVMSASTATEAELVERNEWIRQAAWSQHIQVPVSGHWLHLDHPETVAAAVIEIKDRV